jgi:hypothetical protein
MTEKDVANGTNGVRMSSEVEKKKFKSIIYRQYTAYCAKWRNIKQPTCIEI